jgi:hypothetical protein
MEIISFIPSECMDFPILKNFMTIKELINISIVNKYFNKVSKKQIKKQINELFNFIEKLEKIHILKNNTSLYTYNLEENAINNSTSTNLQNIQREILPYVNENKKTQYNPLYWYNLFGKTLNPQELALYYLYFVLNYHVSGRMECGDIPYLMISKWNCVSYEDGYIKSLAGLDNSIKMSQNKNETEHYLSIKQITNFQKMHDDNSIQFKENDIDFNYMYPNADIIHKISIDLELFKKTYSYIKNNGKFTQDMRKCIYPSLKDAIIDIYSAPIIS